MNFRMIIHIFFLNLVKSSWCCVFDFAFSKSKVSEFFKGFYQNLVIPWYLYKMVTQNMLRTHERKKSFLLKKNVWFMIILFQSNALNIYQITEIAPYMRTTSKFQ